MQNIRVQVDLVNVETCAEPVVVVGHHLLTVRLSIHMIIMYHCYHNYCYHYYHYTTCLAQNHLDLVKVAVKHNISFLGLFNLLNKSKNVKKYLRLRDCIQKYSIV